MKLIKKTISLICITAIVNGLVAQTSEAMKGGCPEDRSPGILYNSNFSVFRQDNGNEFEKGLVCEWENFNGESINGKIIGINSHPGITIPEKPCAEFILEKNNNTYNRKDAIITRLPERYLFRDRSLLYYCQFSVYSIESNCPVGFTVYVASDKGILEMFTVTESLQQGQSFLFYNNSDDFYAYNGGYKSEAIIISPILLEESGSAKIEIDIIDLDFVEGCNSVLSCNTSCASGQIYNGDFQTSSNFPYPYTGEFNYGCVCGWDVFEGSCSIANDAGNYYATMNLTSDKLVSNVNVDNGKIYTLQMNYMFKSHNIDGDPKKEEQDIYIRFSDSEGNLYPTNSDSVDYKIFLEPSEEGIWIYQKGIQLVKPLDMNNEVLQIILFPGNSPKNDLGITLSVDNILFEESTDIKPKSTLIVDYDNCSGLVDMSVQHTGGTVLPEFYDWIFGDGTSLKTTIPEVTHEYVNNSLVKKKYIVGVNLVYETCEEYLESEIFIWPEPKFNVSSTKVLENMPVIFDYSTNLPVSNWKLYFNEITIAQYSGNPSFSESYVFQYPGTFMVILDVEYITKNGVLWCSSSIEITVCSEDCILPFSPLPNKRYVLSLWVKQNVPAPLIYSVPEVDIAFNMGNSGPVTIGPFIPSGNIIDGWQRIYSDFVIPQEALDISVNLRNTSEDQSMICYFDDIRIHPFDGNMKSFVYDPLNLWYLSELDENNYSTFFDYDEEGKLVRVRKETERGIMTIQESRNNIVKKFGE